MSSKYRHRALQLNIACVLLCVCAGCLPAPSKKKQHPVVQSRWITVESEEQDQENQVARLDQEDAKAIAATTPTISTLVVERVLTSTIEAQGIVAKVRVCETRPDYLRLLKDRAKVEVKQGRFLEAGEVEARKRVVVLSEQLAEKLFKAIEPVGQSVVIDGRQQIVVGILSKSIGNDAADITRDAYVPLKLFGPGSSATQNPAFHVDSIRICVQSLDRVNATKTVIRNVLEKRHPQAVFRLR